MFSEGKSSYFHHKNTKYKELNNNDYKVMLNYAVKTLQKELTFFYEVF
jgi:hypothetical protein